MTLSGGMKRRVMIAKALAHEPRVLFLDEPTAGVDVALRQDMWQLVRGLRDSGVTIVLTTHYIDEAEDMADRVGVIRQGKIILVEDKATLMRKLGKKRLTLQLEPPLAADAAAARRASRPDARRRRHRAQLRLRPGRRAGRRRRRCSRRCALPEAGVRVKDLETTQSSLEDIFVNLVRENRCR